MAFFDPNTKTRTVNPMDYPVDDLHDQGVGISNQVINNKVMPMVGTALISTAAGSYFLAGMSPGPAILFYILSYIAAIFTVRIPAIGQFLFYVYAFALGGTMVPLLKLAALTIKPVGVAACFLVTSGIFFGVAGVGMATKRDFTNIGGFLVFGLVAIILLQFSNLFFHFMTPALFMGISSFTIVLMCGFILYDISLIKNQFTNEDYVLAAMTLYLDFVIIFQNILKLAIQIFGSRD